MPKVLFVSPDFKPLRGGIANYAWNLAIQFASKGCVVNIHRSRFAKGMVSAEGISIENGALYVPSGRIARLLMHAPNFLYSMYLLWKKKSQNSYDAVVVTSGYEQVLKLMHFGCPIYTFIHGGEIGFLENRSCLYRSALNGVLYLAALKTSVFIVNSEYTRFRLQAALRNLGVEKDIFVAYCGVPVVEESELIHVDSARKKLELPLDSYLLLSVCRMDDRKGIDTVIRALPALLEWNKNIFYLVIGDGSELSYIKKLTCDLNLEHVVRFFSGIDDVMLHYFYCACDVFVLPNRAGINGDWEGFGIVFLEAAMRAKPVIGGRHGGVIDAVEDGVSGLLVSTDGVNEVGESLLLLLRDGQLRKEMGERGRGRAVRDFSWERISDRILDLLLERACGF